MKKTNVVLNGVTYIVGMVVFDKELGANTEIIEISDNHVVTEHDMIHFDNVSEYLTF